uniref:Uncharacterized protein n=1 Tax=Anguilla anguilla TaxID=7936 RepID=A0A0E9QQD1_ANGAN
MGNLNRLLMKSADGHLCIEYNVLPWHPLSSKKGI